MVDAVKLITLPLAEWVSAASMTQAGDTQLLHRYSKLGEQQAFAILVKRHGPMVWGVARRILRAHHDAEDAFQATFLVLARKASSLRQPQLLANWLHGVAHRTALQLRSRRKYHAELGTEQLPAAVNHDEAAWQECGLLIDKAIDHLPESLRIVFLLCQAEGLTTLAASRRLNVPEGTVVSRLHRARRQLQSLLTRHGIASAAGAVVAAWSLALPEALFAVTVRSILVSTPSALVAGLAQGVLTTMMWIKLTSTAVIVSTLGIVSAGAATFILPAAGDKPAHQFAVPLVQKGDNKEERIRKLMAELEEARAAVEHARAREIILVDQLERERQQSEAVRKFLGDQVLAEKEQKDKAVRDPASGNSGTARGDKQAFFKLEEKYATDKRRIDHFNNARAMLEQEIEKMTKQYEDIQQKQAVMLSEQQQHEVKLQALNKDLDHEMKIAEKQFGFESDKMKELKLKRDTLVADSSKLSLMNQQLSGSSMALNRLQAQIKMREKLMLELDEKLLRMKLKLDE